MSGDTIASPRVTRVLAVLFVVMSIFTVWQISDTRSDLNETQSENARLGHELVETQQRQDESAVQAQALAEQVRDLGERPVVQPDQPDPIAGPPGADGRSPGAADVALAVGAYCAGGRCDGKSPTVAQVAYAVSSFCNANGKCAGPKGDTGASGPSGSNGADGSKGDTGPSGSNGADGSKGDTGPQGPKGDKGDKGDTGDSPSADQILSAVSTYCAENPCAKGDKGDKGDPGEPGADTFPFDFTVEIPDADGVATTYLCRVPASNITGTCQANPV